MKKQTNRTNHKLFLCQTTWDWSVKNPIVQCIGHWTLLFPLGVTIDHINWCDMLIHNNEKFILHILKTHFIYILICTGSIYAIQGALVTKMVVKIKGRWYQFGAIMVEGICQKVVPKIMLLVYNRDMQFVCFWSNMCNSQDAAIWVYINHVEQIHHIILLYHRFIIIMHVLVVYDSVRDGIED